MSQKTNTETPTDPSSDDEYITERVIEGTVMRITGAGNLVVYPSSRTGLIKNGSPVKVVISERSMRMGGLPLLEAREDHIMTPMSSTWAIVVSGRKPIETCRVFYNRTQLATIDHMGELRPEARMPRDGSLSFHIPDSMQLDDDFMVEVRDGDNPLMAESFGAIKPSPIQQR